MVHGEIPQWIDMPEPVSVSTLSWEDTFYILQGELERDPTRKEVFEMFSNISRGMQKVGGDDFFTQLETIASIVLLDYQKEQPYNADKMNTEELLSNKYCHNCDRVSETYWDLASCNKNPDGLVSGLANHGNDSTCDDEYCSPNNSSANDHDINPEYIQKHCVEEKCMGCNSYMESSNPNVGKTS